MAISRVAFTVYTALSFLTGAVHASQHEKIPRATQNRTADLDTLKTWWHNEAEINTKTPVLDENVRQSHLYSVQVSTASSNDYYDSFAYESIPRSGKGQICFPGNYKDICDEYDGVTIEGDVGITMAWSQFLYGADVVVKITRRDGSDVAASDVTLRPTNLDFEVAEADGSVLIAVPYTPETNGVRFSVEFADDIWEYRKGDTGLDYVQNVLPAAESFVRIFTPANPIVGREPKNALLIFASPFPASDLVPEKSEEVYDAKPGWVEGLESIQNKVVSFGPGVYHFTGEGFMNLSSTVEWVYLAPGAYVKGAVQYNNPQGQLKATGFGVLSGEMYVYQANPASGWNNNKSDATSLKMWRGESITAGQSWLMHGLTTANPPFNGMDFYGATSNFSVDVTDYKQVGGFYAQTDGLQMYAGSHLRDIFYHTGDDTIKVYHSNVVVSDIVAWKTGNAPLVQLGWYPRNVTNVTLSNLNMIHSRYSSALDYAPRALIGSSSFYDNLESTATANLSSSISHITIDGIRSEGISPALLGINMLSNYDSFLIKNAYIEELAPTLTSLDIANFTGFTDRSGEKVKLGAKSENGLGLVIQGFKVGRRSISYARENWNLFGVGKVNVDPTYWGNWTIFDAPGDERIGDDSDDDSESIAVRALEHPRIKLGAPAALAVGVGYLATG